MTSIKKIALSLVIFCLITTKLKAQVLGYTQLKPNLGFLAGANLAFGTHFQRIGFHLNFYFVKAHFQSNSECRVYYNLKNLGPKKSYLELVLSQGVMYAWGNKQNNSNSFVSIVSNQTQYVNTLAYAYNAYFNKKKTSQQTGVLVIGFRGFSIISENDLLAKPALDRFRTAAFLLQYQYQNLVQVGFNCTLWTGKYGAKKWTENQKFKKGCYLDTLNGMYTNSSHGLLSLQIKYQPMYFQNYQANVGIDAEQIRNTVQNKFIHDMPFIPKKWNKSNNCHLPMLDENSHPFLYLENQKIRRPKIYLNAFSNGSLFY